MLVALFYVLRVLLLVWKLLRNCMQSVHYKQKTPKLKIGHSGPVKVVDVGRGFPAVD